MQASLICLSLPPSKNSGCPLLPVTEECMENHVFSQTQNSESEFLPVPGVQATSSPLPGFHSGVKIFSHPLPLSTRELQTPHHPLDKRAGACEPHRQLQGCPQPPPADADPSLFESAKVQRGLRKGVNRADASSHLGYIYRHPLPSPFP